MSNYKANKVSIKFIDSETKETLLEKLVEPGTQYRLSVMDTSSDREDYIPIIKKSDNFYYGPVGFIIEDGETSPKGDKKWIFDRVINKDTTIEVEMMKFDYYFESITDAEFDISVILSNHNNDLSNISIGFGDGVTSLQSSNTGLFQRTSINKSPKILFGRNITDCSYLFYRCNLLTSIPEGLFDNCPLVISFNSTFSYCNSLTSIPNGLFDNCTEVITFQETFYNCNSLTSIPAGLFDNCLLVTNFNGTFSRCSKITSIPEGLFDNCPLVTNFGYTFYNCGSVTSNIPDAWNIEKHPNVANHRSYARACINAANYDQIPEDWK